MSVTATIFVLFKCQPTEADLGKLAEAISNRTGAPVGAETDRYERLMPVEDADLLTDVEEGGVLHYLERERMSKLIGAPSLDGRLFSISYLSRYWRRANPEGPALRYILTMLTMLAQSSVEGVWYTADSYQDGVRIPPMTHDLAHQMIDDFVAVGETFYGKPVRYVRTDAEH